MVLSCLTFVLIAGVLYLLTYPDNRFTVTASAIRQIWSGSCRLNCRQSEFSGFSGLSGLNTGHIQEKKNHTVAQSSDAGPSSACVCESCPCALIENVLRTCSPVTTMYASTMDAIAAQYYAILETLSDIYNYLERVMHCGTSCQRRPQLIESQDSTSDNIYFGDKKYRDSLEKVTEKARKPDSALKTDRSIVFRAVSDTEISKKLPDNSGPKVGVSDTTLRPKEDETEPSEEINSCPKCVEQHKVCMKSCPKAYVKK